jgi:hypothetical protein
MSKGARQTGAAWPAKSSFTGLGKGAARTDLSRRLDLFESPGVAKTNRARRGVAGRLEAGVALV